MNQNILVIEPASSLRTSAREALRGRWMQGFLAALLYLALMFLPTVILMGLFGDLNGGSNYSYYDYGYDYGFSYRDNFPWAVNLYMLLISGPMSLGFAMFVLAIVRGREASPGMVLSGFSYFGKALGLYLITSILIFLWTLLFIIPGIIAAYRYRMVYYILADDPNIGIMDTIRESKRMMTGNKFKFFCLEISFIGWAFLASLAYFALTVWTMFLSSVFMMFAVMMVLLCPIMAVLMTYMEVAFAGFYQILIGGRREMLERQYGGGEAPGPGNPGGGGGEDGSLNRFHLGGSGLDPAQTARPKKSAPEDTRPGPGTDEQGRYNPLEDRLEKRDPEN